MTSVDQASSRPRRFWYASIVAMLGLGLSVVGLIVPWVKVHNPYAVETSRTVYGADPLTLGALALTTLAAGLALTRVRKGHRQLGWCIAASVFGVFQVIIGAEKYVILIMGSPDETTETLTGVFFYCVGGLFLALGAALSYVRPAGRVFARLSPVEWYKSVRAYVAGPGRL